MTLDGALEADVDRDAVAFVFTVRNAGDERVELQFPDACQADVAVLEDGEEVWRFSAGRMYAQMVQFEELPPGDTSTYDFEWDDPAPGEYEAVASLRATDADCEARATITV